MMSDPAGQQVRLTAEPVGPNDHSGSAAAPTLFPTEEGEYLTKQQVYSGAFQAFVRQD